MMVEVDDELSDRVSEEGMGLVDMAAGRDESDDPDMPVSLSSLKMRISSGQAFECSIPEERRVGPE